MLDETSTNTKLLLDTTMGLKENLRKVHGEIESVHGACRALESKLESKLDSGPLQPMHNSNVVKFSLTDRSKYCSPADRSNKNFDSANIILSNIYGHRGIAYGYRPCGPLNGSSIH